MTWAYDVAAKETSSRPLPTDTSKSQSEVIYSITKNVNGSIIAGIGSMSADLLAGLSCGLVGKGSK